ncbi:MAG: hypothetical protein R3B71_06060 [Candidatus Gracilibacteria bacterium]|nr:hypothetical protein [Candidatus Peregrinibacteria bacterium]
MKFALEGKQKFIAIAAVAVMFAGCTADSDSTLTPNSTVQGTETMSVIPPETIELTETEQAAISGALELNDPSYCQKITAEEARQFCITTLNDRQLNEEALKNGDAASCAGLSTQDLQDACRIQVEVQQQRQQAQEDLQDNLYLSDEIGVAGDISRCSAEIADPTVIAQCELNILVNQAIQERSPAACSQATTQETQEKCREDYEVLTTPPPGGPGDAPLEG